MSLEVPTSDGQIRRRTVTRRCLEQMKREKKMQKVDGEVVRVHHLGLHGYYVEHCVIGQDISPDMAQRFRDPQTNEMYAASFMEKGEKKTYFLKRDKWETMNATLAEKGFSHASSQLGECVRQWHRGGRQEK